MTTSTSLGIPPNFRAFANPATSGSTTDATGPVIETETMGIQGQMRSSPHEADQPTLLQSALQNHDPRTLLDDVLRGATEKSAQGASARAAAEAFRKTLLELAGNEHLSPVELQRELARHFGLDWRIQMNALHQEMGQHTTMNDIYVICANMTKEWLAAEFPDRRFHGVQVRSQAINYGGYIISYYDSDPAIKYRITEKPWPWWPFNKRILDIEITLNNSPITRTTGEHLRLNTDKKQKIHFKVHDPAKLASLAPLIRQLKGMFEPITEIVVSSELPDSL